VERLSARLVVLPALAPDVHLVFRANRAKRGGGEWRARRLGAAVLELHGRAGGKRGLAAGFPGRDAPRRRPEPAVRPGRKPPARGQRGRGFAGHRHEHRPGVGLDLVLARLWRSAKGTGALRESAWPARVAAPRQHSRGGGRRCHAGRLQRGLDDRSQLRGPRSDLLPASLEHRPPVGQVAGSGGGTRQPDPPRLDRGGVLVLRRRRRGAEQDLRRGGRARRARLLLRRHGPAAIAAAPRRGRGGVGRRRAPAATGGRPGDRDGRRGRPRHGSRKRLHQPTLGRRPTHAGSTGTATGSARSRRSTPPRRRSARSGRR
jgi:hypothetical protein